MSKHTCHARGCAKPISERLLMCYRHWMMVPMRLKHDVWETYRHGQETDKNPSPEYLAAARAAIDAVAEKEQARG